MSNYPRTIFEVPRVIVEDYTPALPHLIGTPAIYIIAEPFEITIEQRGSSTLTPPAAINPALDQSLVASAIVTTVSILGTWLNIGIVADPILVTVSILSDEEVAGEIFSSSALIELEVTIGNGLLYIVAGSKKNWVQWSNIGHLDFTVGRDNVAGERPLDWKGWIYAIKKLGSKSVVYGQGGVTLLTPAGNAYGMQTINRIGLKGKHAVCGTDSEHFFVDAEGHLYQLDDKLDLLDYCEYLDTLTSSIVMSYDEENKLIYICDGASGFVYSIADKSLGEGPANVTGIGSQGGALYVAAPAAVSIPVFDICTDIYDFGTRKAKTIRSVELGTDMTKTLTVAIDYRRDKAVAFLTTPWRTVNAKGIAYITCFGNEFRIRAKSSAYEYFELDYITLSGAIHDY